MPLRHLQRPRRRLRRPSGEMRRARGFESTATRSRRTCTGVGLGSLSAAFGQDAIYRCCIPKADAGGVRSTFVWTTVIAALEGETGCGIAGYHPAPDPTGKSGWAPCKAAFGQGAIYQRRTVRKSSASAPTPSTRFHAGAAARQTSRRKRSNLRKSRLHHRLSRPPKRSTYTKAQVAYSRRSWHLS